MFAYLLACPTPDTTVPPEIIATPEVAPTAQPAVPHVTLTARADVTVAQDADGAEHPTTRFFVRARDGAGVETSTNVVVPGVCTSTDASAWACDGVPFALATAPEVAALVPANATVAWTAPTPMATVPVRLRYDAVDGHTHLVVEAFHDTTVVVSGSADVPGTCVPSASPPAGREDGNVYLTCTDAGVSTLVKLVERDRHAALTRRPSSAKVGTDEVFYDLAPPDGYRFDL